MKILATGAQGQIASALAEMSGGGLEVISLGRPELDITDPSSIGRALAHHQPDVVVNTAAYTAVDKAESEPDQAFRVNAEGAGIVAAACALASVPVIHISTDYVFDGEKPSPYVETDRAAPLSVYGRSKLAGEAEVARLAPEHVILRTSWVFGPAGTNFLKTMLRLAETREEIGVVDDQHGAPTYAPHLAAAIVAIADRLRDPEASDDVSGLYHVTASGATTWCGFAREIFRREAERGRRVPTVRGIATRDYPLPARRPANSRLDCGKLEQVFGLRLPDWTEGVAACLNRIDRAGG